MGILFECTWIGLRLAMLQPICYTFQQLQVNSLSSTHHAWFQFYSLTNTIQICENGFYSVKLNLSKVDPFNLSNVDLFNLSKVDLFDLSKVNLFKLSKVDLLNLSKVDFSFENCFEKRKSKQYNSKTLSKYIGDNFILSYFVIRTAF